MKTNCLAALIAFTIPLFTVARAFGDWVPWPVSQGGNGHSYLAVQVATPISWDEASRAARDAGGYLATITSAEENAFVFALINHPQYWNGGLGPLLGGYQPPGSPEPASGWTWVTGEAWGYSNWAGGQPDNGDAPSEDGLCFLSGGVWNDKRTNQQAFLAYVVERNTIICSPRKARAVAQLVNGFVVGATITDPGCGYTNAPVVLIQGGGGSGATATATVIDGQVTAIQIMSAGCCYTNAPTIVIGSPPFVPTVGIRVSKVKVSQNVVLGRRYVLESSNDLATWTATGPPFTAESETMENEFDVDHTGRFFRLREVP